MASCAGPGRVHQPLGPVDPDTEFLPVRSPVRTRHSAFRLKDNRPAPDQGEEGSTAVGNVRGAALAVERAQQDGGSPVTIAAAGPDLRLEFCDPQFRGRAGDVRQVGQDGVAPVELAQPHPAAGRVQAN